MTSSPTIFEIYEIPGERWANLINFGIKLKDSHRAADFDNLGFALEFNTSEFEYVAGTFLAGTQTKDVMSTAQDYLNDQNADSGKLAFALMADSAENADGTALDAPFNYTQGATYTDGNGDTVTHDDYIAKFMLKRIDDSSGTNEIKHFGNYNQLTVESGAIVEKEINPTETTIEEFDYGPDSLTIDVKTPAGTNTAPNVELFVSNGTVADGLSIVPIQKMGDLVQFQVMMNISYPTTIIPDLTHAVNATINITADEIFTDSLYSRSDDSAVVGGSVVATASFDPGTGVQNATLVAEAADAENAVLPADATNFMQKLEVISNQESPDFSALSTASEVSIAFTQIGGGTQIAQDGKYVLAEFWARNSDVGVSYTYTDNDEADDPLTQSVNESTEPEENITIKSGMLPDGKWTGTVKDGSDVTLLGDSFYINPFSELRSITSNDASTALKMAVADPETSGYDQADFIAADFNRDGKVTSSDALDILKTAAYIDPEDQEAYPTWFYVRDMDTAAEVKEDGGAPTVSFDQHLDLFIGQDTDITATAVLTGDTDHDFRLLDNKANPVYDYFSGLIGSFVSPTQVTAGGGTSGEGGTGGENSGGGGTTLTLTTASFGVASTDKADAVGAPNAEHLVTSTDEHDVTDALDPPEGGGAFGAGTTAVKITDGMMIAAAGGDKLNTWQEAAKAAEIVAGAVNPTNNTDHVVVGWFDGTDTIVIEVDDATTEGTFVAKKATKVTGEATALNTQDNAAGSIYIDTAAAPVNGGNNTGSLSVVDSGKLVSSTTDDVCGAPGHTLMPEVSAGVNVSDADPDTGTGVTATVNTTGMMTITGGSIDTADEAAHAASLVAAGSNTSGTPDNFVVGWFDGTNTIVFKMDDANTDGTFVVTGASKYGGNATDGLSTTDNTATSIKVDTTAHDQNQGGGDQNQGGVVDVTGADPAIATAEVEVFKLPTAGASEIVQFNSKEFANGDIVEGFAPAEDTIKISATVTSLTDLGEVNANTESEAMGAVPASFSAAVYVPPAGGLVLVNIVDVDTETYGDQGGQMLVIDSTGNKDPDYMIMFEDGTFADAAAAVGAVDFIA